MSITQSLKQQVCQAYTIASCICLFALSALSFHTTLDANPSSRSELEPVELGYALETKFWTLVQKQNVQKFSAKIAPIFLGLNLSGIYTRDQQIAGLTGVTLESFSIENPVATRSGNVLVFSYHFEAPDSDLVSGPSISIWQKKNHSWKLVSHSYVPEIPPSEPLDPEPAGSG